MTSDSGSATVGPGGEPPAAPAASHDPPARRRELIVIAEPDAGIRATPDTVMSITGQDVSVLASIIAAAGATLRPLFGSTPDQPAGLAQAVSGEATEMSRYYHVQAPDDQLEQLAQQLAAAPGVAAAYVKPAIELPLLAGADSITPLAEAAAAVTPDFSDRQIYLNDPPVGVAARYAWTVPGGRGAGIQVVDCEQAWRFDHEDLIQNQGGVISGVQSAAVDDRNHGTAVLGSFHGDVNSFGVIGICPDTYVRAVPFGDDSAAAIKVAADALNAGDILLLEGHRPGPRYNFAVRADQLGYIPIEWWPDDFIAIAYATAKGVVVVEAAGNGAENLDDPLYNAPPIWFYAKQPDWTNSFNRANRDSRAILVGAGAPPPGTHGRYHGPDRSRLSFSNFGACVDVQGWGQEVTTCGYGDLQGGADERVWYTDTFRGTSSASPIVAGVIGSFQGVVRARGKPLPSPLEIRASLRGTGCPQQDGLYGPATQRIGNRPALRQLILPKVYFFKADKYVRFDIPTGQVDGGYPLPIAGYWPGLTQAGFDSGIDAAVNWDYVNPQYSAKAYFFKGDKYLRYDIPSDTVDWVPLPIAGNWPGFTEAGFGSGIDAALNYGNGKAYFFKADKYLRYDIASDKVDAGYPLPIAVNWPGLAEAGFGSGIDAAINYGDGKVYFFKADKYLRYDMASDTVDFGYPLPIAGYWRGMSEANFVDGVKAAVEWRRV